MTSGYLTRYIIENFIRIQLDTYGYGDVTIHYDENQTWVLYQHGNLVGKATYDLENILIQVKPTTFQIKP